MKVKLFTDLSLLKIGFPVEILIPFIGLYNKEDEPGSVMFGRFDNYLKHGKDFLELTNIEECDVCVFPICWDVLDNIPNFKEATAPFLNKVANSNKKILIFAGHDIQVTNISIPNAIIFNSAGSKSKQAANVFAWPHFFEDFLKKYYSGIHQSRTKTDKPTVGFCGFAPPLNIHFGKQKMIGFTKLVLNYLGFLQMFPQQISHSYRARAIIALKRSKKVNTNFRIKNMFAFGPQGQLNTGNVNESHETFRRNFVDNIINSDYTLCVRGIGNNSIRFFESLCCGRIPVFVNTDSALPYDDVINWKDLCVWVEEKDIDRIGEKIEDFHRNITEKEFVALQIKLRSIWEDYFTPVGFYKNILAFTK